MGVVKMKYDSCLALYDLAKEIDWGWVKTQLKPGAHIVSITPLLEHHRVTAAMEDYGIEIRDCILFLGTPSYMVALGRLPLEGTVAENVLKHGTGALSIDGCRVGIEILRNNPATKLMVERPWTKRQAETGKRPQEKTVIGRWPSNVILSNCPTTLGKFPDNKGSKPTLTKRSPDSGNRKSYGTFNGQPEVLIGYGDTGSTSRFFYNVSEDNSLPELIRYLCKLCTPPRGKALVVGLGSEAIIGLESLGFNVFQYSNDE